MCEKLATERLGMLLIAHRWGRVYEGVTPFPLGKFLKNDSLRLWLFFFALCKFVDGGGHWGALNTATPQKISPNTASLWSLGFGCLFPRELFNLDPLKCGFLSDYVGHFFLLYIEALMY